MVRLIKITIVVSDLEQAMRFYGNVLQTEGTPLSRGRYVFTNGAVQIICYDPLLEGDAIGHGWMMHPGQYLYFGVANIDTAYIRFKNIGCNTIDAKISEDETGRRFFYASDPFGNPLCIMEEERTSYV